MSVVIQGSRAFYGSGLPFCVRLYQHGIRRVCIVGIRGMLRAVHIAVCSFWLGLAATTAVAQSDAVLRAQERLENLGLSPGPADGVMGSRTRAAISEFQRRNKRPVRWPQAIPASCSGQDTIRGASAGGGIDAAAATRPCGRRVEPNCLAGQCAGAELYGSTRNSRRRAAIDGSLPYARPDQHDDLFRYRRSGFLGALVPAPPI